MPGAPAIQLATLDDPPSWHNAAGRVDRSACLNLDVRKLWRQLPDDAWRPAQSESRPGTRAPGSKTHREAVAHFTLTAADLDRLLALARPFQLLGDFRTEKANAMRRIHHGATEARSKRSRQDEQDQQDNDLHIQSCIHPVDPVKTSLRIHHGATEARSKRSRQDEQDQQDNDFHIHSCIHPVDPVKTSLRIHHGDMEALNKKSRQDEQDQQDSDLHIQSCIHPVDPVKTSSPCLRDSVVNASFRRTPRTMNPNLGAAAVKVHGVEPTWSQTFRLERWRLHEKLARHFIFCPRCDGRRFKLYLPLCTPAEARDAHFALAHLQQHAAGNKPLTEPQRRLIDRYATLFSPRRILCADCLHMRFGYIHPRKNDHTRELTAPDNPNDPALSLLALPPAERRAALLDHIAELKRRRDVHQRASRIRKAYELIEQYKATEGDDLAFLNLARKFLR
ncbi:hypothetical protein HED60_16345 [Planctomycetales bacterium ZRK34]|nr:hypothetical protein HED60_16345 [Planctomycetales bacterium ZRK34]